MCWVISFQYSMMKEWGEGRSCHHTSPCFISIYTSCRPVLRTGNENSLGSFQILSLFWTPDPFLPVSIHPPVGRRSVSLLLFYNWKALQSSVFIIKSSNLLLNPDPCPDHLKSSIIFKPTFQLPIPIPIASKSALRWKLF
jgi:hypothetical protein